MYINSYISKLIKKKTSLDLVGASPTTPKSSVEDCYHPEVIDSLSSRDLCVSVVFFPDHGAASIRSNTSAS
eukprot:gene9339-6562_t